VLEGENDNLRASNAAFTREATKLEWCGASVFDDECTDDWPITGARRKAKFDAAVLVRRALAAACCSGSRRVSSGRSSAGRRSSGRNSVGSALNDDSDDENKRGLPVFGPSSVAGGGGGAGSSSAGDGGGVGVDGADG
jgi:hypothetical protein